MTSSADPYLNLLAETLTRYGRGGHLKAVDPWDRRTAAARGFGVVERVLGKANLVLARPVPSNDEARSEGRNWPSDDAETMAGLKRLANTRYCIETALADGVPGDVMECGVWRGGMSIYMAATLAAHGATDRNVWVADSFEGLPVPETARYASADEADLSAINYLAVGVDAVKANFERYHLLGDNIQFLKGWFKDTLPTAPVDKLAVLRLDGDLYSSTMDVLIPMYDKVSSGGFIIVDDYFALPECERAIQDFRRERGITEPIEQIDWTGVYWRKA